MTVSPANTGNVKVNGTIYTGSCGYNSGTVLNLEAVPADTYKFDRWGGALSGSANPTTLSMSSSKSVIAYFTLKTQSVSLQETKNLLDGTKYVLVLDVRSATDYAASHMLCAKNYEWNSGANDFSTSITDLTPYKESEILIYDNDGAKSAAAALYLGGQGFENVSYMTDAFDPDWIAEYETFTTAQDEEDCTSLAPIAYAGEDQTGPTSVDEKQPVFLDGSSPSSGVTYAWNQVGGVNNVVLSDPTAPKPTFTAPDLNGGDDTLVFQLTVTDGGGKTDTDRVNVDVNWINEPPDANAGPDQTVIPGSSVNLDGSASSDPEGSIVSYQWDLSNGMGSFPPSLTGPTPTFTAPDTEGWAIYTLTVTDNGVGEDEGTDTDTVRVEVQEEVVDPNSPPLADAGSNQTVTESLTVTLDGSGSSDSDGTIASYAWSQTGTPAVTLSDPSAAQPTFAAPAVSSSTVLTFTLTVVDDDGATDTDIVLVTVNDDGTSPVPQNAVPTANAGPDQSVKENKTVTLDGSGSQDSDGTIATYAWTQTDGTGVTVVLSSNSAAKPTFTAPEVDDATTLTFALIVTDNEGASSSSSDTVSITITKSSGGGGGGGCFIDSLAD